MMFLFINRGFVLIKSSQSKSLDNLVTVVHKSYLKLMSELTKLNILVKLNTRF